MGKQTPTDIPCTSETNPRELCSLSRPTQSMSIVEYIDVYQPKKQARKKEISHGLLEYIYMNCKASQLRGYLSLAFLPW